MENKLLLLGILRRHEMHGYQLYEYIDQGLSTCTDLKKPTAYFLLNKMAQGGWISEESAQEGNRPPRKVYRLTAAGEAAFQSLLRQNLAAYAAPAFSGDTGLAFLDDIDPAEAVLLLQQRRSAMLEALAVAQTAPPHSGSVQLVLEHQRCHLSAELAWLDSVIEKLQGVI